MKIKNTLKKLNQRGFSHHILMPVAVLVAVTAIGVKVLTQSHAATNYTFVRYASQMSGGTLVTKSGGASYRSLSSSDSYGQVITTWISSAESAKSNYICVHYLGGSGSFYVSYSDPSGSTPTGPRFPNGSSGYWCVPNNYHTINALKVQKHATNSAIQVDTIYGKP